MKIIEYIKNPKKAVFYLGIHGYFKFLKDRDFISLMYYCRFGEKPDLNEPKTFNEKLQWLKLYYNGDEYKDLVDKYEVKKHVTEKIGSEYVIQTLGVWDTAEKIDFDSLPNQFVLKCTHDSGGLVICKDKKTLDKKKAIRKLRKALRNNYYWVGREPFYKNIKPKIIAETYLTDETSCDLKDYKVLCFSGVPRIIELHAGRYTDHQSQDFYDTEWNKLSISQNGVSAYQATNIIEPRPETLNQMIEFSRVLSKDLPHLRVDWYSIGNKLYFGELTFFDGSGFDPFDNPSDDLLFGSWISLPC